jgi:hypothetical protein
MSGRGIDSNTNALNGRSSAIFHSEIIGMTLFDLNRLAIFIISLTNLLTAHSTPDQHPEIAIYVRKS